MEGLDVAGGGGAACERVKGVSIVKAIVFGTGNTTPASRSHLTPRDHTRSFVSFQCLRCCPKNGSLTVIPTNGRSTSNPTLPTRICHLTWKRSNSRQDIFIHSTLAYVSNCDFEPYLRPMQLHESYGEKANRIVSKPPYQLIESGWGEFEIQVNQVPLVVVLYFLWELRKTELLELYLLTWPLVCFVCLC